MSIIGFHKVLISVAILFCLGFSFWQGARYAEAGGGSSLVLSLVFGGLTAALVYYLLHLRRFLGREESP